MQRTCEPSNPGASSGLDPALPMLAQACRAFVSTRPHPPWMTPKGRCSRYLQRPAQGFLAAGASGFLLEALFATFELVPERSSPSD